MLDTRNEKAIHESLSAELNVRKETVQVFFAKYMPDYVCKNYWEINLSIFYEYFDLKKEVFTFDEVVFYHVTTRLSRQKFRRI